MNYSFHMEDLKSRCRDGLNVVNASNLEFSLEDDNVQSIAKSNLFTQRVKRLFFAL